MARFDSIETPGNTRALFHSSLWCNPRNSTTTAAGSWSPLVRAAAIGKVSFTGFNPTFKIRGTSVVLHPLGIVSIPVDQLGEMVGLLSDDSQLIIAALDELLRALGSNSCAMCGLPI